MCKSRMRLKATKALNNFWNVFVAEAVTRLNLRDGKKKKNLPSSPQRQRQQQWKREKIQLQTDRASDRLRGSALLLLFLFPLPRWCRHTRARTHSQRWHTLTRPGKAI